MAAFSPVMILKSGVPTPADIALSKRVTSIGKHPNCDVVLNNPYVSRTHAQIEIDNGQARIRDLNSKNGTFVNGSRVGDGVASLPDGALIEFGQNQVVAQFAATQRTVTQERVPDAADAGSGLVVDQASHQIWIDNQVLVPEMTKKQFDILFLLNSRPGQVCTHIDLARSGWPERPDYSVDETEIRQYISRIRSRLSEIETNPVRISTVRGIGYRLDVVR